jgi:hypothetical protein
MLTWVGEFLVRGCRPARRHLDELLTEAIRGVSSPVVRWEAIGPGYVAEETHLADLATTVDDRVVQQLTLTVASGSQPDRPVVEVVFGSDDVTLQFFFLGIFATWGKDRGTRVKVWDANRAHGEDRAVRIEKVLHRTRPLRGLTKLLFWAQYAMQTYVLWNLLFVTGPKLVAQAAEDGKVAEALIAGAGASFVMLGGLHMAVDVLTVFRVKLKAPAQGAGFLSSLVGTPTAAALTQTVVGVLALILAVVAIVVDLVKG